MIRGISGRSDAQLRRAAKGEDIDNPVSVKAGTKMTVDDYKALFEANNEDEELGALFNRVYDVAKALGLNIDVFNDENTGTSAYYDNSNSIRINEAHWNTKKIVNSQGKIVTATKGLRAQVLCHELIHSVTSYANYWYDHNPEYLPDNLREAATELNDVYNKIMHDKESYKIPMYARENKDELVAEMANPEVREPLKKIGMWTRLVNAVKKFFMGDEKKVAVEGGFAQEKDFEQSTVYNELSKTLDKFLNNFDKDSYDAFIRISGTQNESVRNMSFGERYDYDHYPLGRVEPGLAKKKAEAEQAKADKREKALRDEVVGTMRKAGLDVSMDTNKGQWVLDHVNGKARMSAKKRRALETASLGETPRSLTVVSSADGAKVLKNVDTLATEFDNSATQPKTFVGDVAKALGAERHGSASEYATFETKNGRIVTIRLANHNAKVSNFDNRNESEGISIVVSPKKSEGMTNDGAAHVVEYYYDALKLRRADGKPLAEIVRSIKQALYSGEFTDTTGLAERQEVNADDVVRYNKVYHGSGADFDHFDHSHMGEGEGAQAYGWGTYVTEVEGIGRTYAETTSKKYAPTLYYEYDRNKRKLFLYEEAKAGIVDDINRYKNLISRHRDIIANTDDPKQRERSEKVKERAERNLQDAQTKILDVQRRIDEVKDWLNKHPYVEPTKHLYTVEIPDDTGSNYLDWDGVVTDKQSWKASEALAEYPKEACHYMWENSDMFGLSDSDLLAIHDNPEKIEKDELTRLLFNHLGNLYNGKSLYQKMKDILGSDKKASLVLHDAGFVGIKYPADFMRGGRKDGKKNYVIFNEADAKITDHVRFFRTVDGEVYGFTDGKKIYLDTKNMKPDTALHEYTHLWGAALRRTNAEEWDNVKGLLDKVDGLKAEIQKLYPELKGEDLYDEMLAMFSGREGTKKLEDVCRKLAAEEGKRVTDSAKEQGFIDKVKTALQKFWKATADLLHVHFTSAEDVADKVLADWARGYDPRELSDDSGSGNSADPVKPKVEVDEYGISIDADLYWSGEADKRGVVDGVSGKHPRITAEHNTRAGVTTLYVHIFDENAETPTRIREILEKEGYKIDTNGSSSGFVRFKNYEDAKRFSDHVDVVQKQVDYERALDHESKVEQEWEEKIQDYVFEHYPTQATLSAESTSEQGLREREAMKKDPVLKEMREKAKAATDKAREASTAALAKQEEAKDNAARREKAAREINRQSAIEQEQKESEAKCRPQVNELLEAVDSGDKGRVKKAKEALTKALLENGVGNARLRDLLRIHKPSRKKDDERRNLNKAATEAIEAAVKTLESEIETKLAEVGLEGVHLEWNDSHQAWWLYADKESPYHNMIERMDNNERWIFEFSIRDDANSIPPVTKYSVKKLAEGIKAELTPSAARRKEASEEMSADGGVSAIAPTNKGQAARTTDKSAHKGTNKKQKMQGKDGDSGSGETSGSGNSVWDKLNKLFNETPEQIAAEEEKRRKEYEAEKRAEIQKKFDAEKEAFKNSKNNEYADVLRESKTPEEAAEKFRQMAAEKRAVAEDWSSRKYKKNNEAIKSHDIYGEEKVTTISAANERRRRAAINNALEAAKDYDDFADTILKRCGLPKGYGNGTSKLRFQKAEAEQAKADKREKALRDEVVGTMRKAGLDVSMDTNKGQWVLDHVNGKARMSAKKRRALETASVSHNEEHQQTVISSADGAKVLKNLDSLASDYENSQQTKEKTFLGETAKALGAERHGSASEYATFETKNGRIVTIRLANHNAKVSNFDNRDESEGISIVVSPKKSEGMTNDGAAHVVEYYYDAVKLRRADGKPLAEIVRSIKQALYSGEFTDTTGLAERQEVNADDVVRYNKVYHGSGADFDHFDHSHMGEGEGAQAYGWGTYVTEVEGIGRTYAETTSKKYAPTLYYEL